DARVLHPCEVGFDGLRTSQRLTMCFARSYATSTRRMPRELGNVWVNSPGESGLKTVSARSFARLEIVQPFRARIDRQPRRHPGAPGAGTMPPPLRHIHHVALLRGEQRLTFDQVIHLTF